MALFPEQFTRISNSARPNTSGQPLMMGPTAGQRPYVPPGRNAAPVAPVGVNPVSGKAPTPYVSPTGGFNKDGGVGPQGQSQLSKAYSNPQTTQMNGVSPTIRKPGYEDFRNSAYGAQYQRNRNYALRDIAKAQSDAQRMGRETAAQAGVAPGTARYQRAIDSSMSTANEAALGIKKQLGEQESADYGKYLGRQEQLEDRNAAATTAALQQLADGNEEAAKTIAMMTAQGKTPQEIMQFLGTQNADGTFTFKSTFAPKEMEQQAIDAKVSEYSFASPDKLAALKKSHGLPDTATNEELARKVIGTSVDTSLEEDATALDTATRTAEAEDIFGLKDEVPSVDVEALLNNPGSARYIGESWTDLRPRTYSKHSSSHTTPAGTAYSVNGSRYISLGLRTNPTTGQANYAFVYVDGPQAGSIGYKTITGTEYSRLGGAPVNTTNDTTAPRWNP